MANKGTPLLFPFRPGMEVLVRIERANAYTTSRTGPTQSGVVIHCRADHTYGVKFDDGTVDMKVPGRFMIVSPEQVLVL